MINKILGTALSRILNAIINLAVIILISRYIGREGYGIIGLVVVAISIIQIFVDLLGGGALIYFSPRKNQLALLVISYLWILIVLLLFAMAIYIFQDFSPDLFHRLIPPGEEKSVLVLAALNAFMLTHYNLLIGKGKIKQYNIVFVVQILSFISSLIYLLFVARHQDYTSYISALEISYGVGFALSTVFTIRYFNFGGNLHPGEIVKEMFSFGLISQIANGFHILNKRISFYFISSMAGLSSLGVYNAGVQLSEGLRLIGQSISLVQFSAISNSDDRIYAVSLTVKLMKLSVLLTFIGLVVLLVIPVGAYEYLFTKEFVGIKYIILALSPGVLALSANTIFSHYFSGLGNPKISLWANIVGFAFTITFALVLIPVLGYLGAALTASVSYSSTVVYQYFVFKKQTGVMFRQWLPEKKDFIDFKIIILTLINDKNIEDEH
ncbi:MAG: oligosaccharide flippase family protein [Chlorobi bacterium]|nr:oligosaccharide flippase family protein [Chlorobiota bacterium]